MADFGIFEAAISSEAEVGLARQAAIDSLSAAIYDVREKLGPALFAASSLEEFRDRVAMMKNDQSLFKIISAHTPPVTGTVRRIVGKNSVLEKEFKAHLAQREASDYSRYFQHQDPQWLKKNPQYVRNDEDEYGRKLKDDADLKPGYYMPKRKKKADAQEPGWFGAGADQSTAMPGSSQVGVGNSTPLSKSLTDSFAPKTNNDQFVDGPSGTSGSAGVAGAPTGGSIDTDPTNNGGKGSFMETGKFPTQVTSSGTTLQPGQSYNLNTKQVSSSRIACYPGCEKNEAHAKKYHQKKEAGKINYRDNFTNQVAANVSRGEAAGYRQGHSTEQGQSRAVRGVSPTTSLDAKTGSDHLAGRLLRGLRYLQSAGAVGEPSGQRQGSAVGQEDWGTALQRRAAIQRSAEALRFALSELPTAVRVSDRQSLLADLRGVLRTAGAPEGFIDHVAGFEGTQDLDETFEPSEGPLVPTDNFDGYLDSVDQGAPEKVERNFTSAVLYRDWCEANNLSPIRLSSLDAYADRLSDGEYMRLASHIQRLAAGDDWPSSHNPATHKGQPKSKLKDVTAGQRMAYDPSEDHQSKYGPRHQWSAGDNMPDHGAKSGIDYPDWGEDGRPTVQWDEGPSKGPGKHRSEAAAGDHWTYNSPGAKLLKQKLQESDERNPDGARWDEEKGWHDGVHVNPVKVKKPASVDPMRAYINWCQYNGLQRISARNVARFAGNDTRLCIHLAQRMRNAIHAASRRQAGYRTAAPDYLQKADDALTQLLNQKAQEFQETIAPLQQALVTVQQAEQLQQQQNPMNVLPPPGTVNVMPGQAAPGQVGQPDPSGGADPSAAAAAALAPPPSDPGQAGLGAAPGGGVPTDQSGPPPAAGPEGALPPELMQATARRRGGQGKGRPPTGGHRTANGSVFDLWERWKSDPNYTQRGGEPDYEAFAKAYNVGERAITKLRQQHASVRAVNRYIAWCTRRGLRAADKKVMTGYHNKVGAAERRRLAAALRRIATEDNDPYGGGFNPNSDPSQRPPSNSVGKGGTPPPVETPPPNPMPNIVPPGPAQVGPWPVYGAPGNNTAGDIPGMIGLPTVPGMGFQPHASRRTAKEPVNIAEEAATNQWRKMDSALSAKGYKYDKASKHWTKPGARPVKNHWQIKASWSRLADYLDVRQAAADADLLKAEGDEISTIGEYQDFAQSARALGDDAAANAFEDIIDDEREHVQRFDDQLDRVAANDDWQPVVQGKYVYPGSEGFRPKDDHSQCRHPDACVVQHPELLKKAGVLDVRQGAQTKVGWTGWGPSVAPKTRQVDNWEWNERLAGYTSGVPQRFSCHCGSLFDAPGGYHKCGCGKTWNSYVIGQGGPSHTASADLYIVREIPVRPGVIVASHGSLDAGPEVSELSGVEFRSGKRTAREDSSPSRGQERVSLRLSERREAGNGSSLPHSRSRSADVPGIAEGGGGDSPSQRQSARQPARESGLRDQGRQHAGHDPARHTVAAGQDALPIRSSAGSTESGATPTEVGLAFLSGVRAGTQASGEAPRVGFSNRGESVLPTDHDYIASIYKLTDPGELDEGEDDGRPRMKSTPSDWHRRDKNQRWTKAARRG